METVIGLVGLMDILDFSVMRLLMEESWSIKTYQKLKYISQMIGFSTACITLSSEECPEIYPGILETICDSFFFIHFLRYHKNQTTILPFSILVSIDL